MVEKRFVPLSLLAALLLLGACDAPGGGAAIGDDEATPTQVAPIKVNLPPPPSFQKDHAPEKYADGTVSIYGLRKQLRRNLNKGARVKAFVLEVYQCPDCKGKDCPPCDKPHLWLSDRATGPKGKALMVTDFPKRDPQTRRKLKFHTGIQYIISGLFARNSPSGFSASDGLLVYEDGGPVVTD